ncbi:Cytochrome P450 71D8 [Hibiscus syriacus]|uniref:Cytochrome P450 71D8 n=1 Tax=Hibiscus syriacus TaxID=106335 RepID=A0A6A2Y9Y1_HIBSY|nr:cytochrome P450 71D10-like [Hibiscus syriacus]KAE8679155.1 Cytochrome P450 71D8 [Hibiscus syriacus]
MELQLPSFQILFTILLVSIFIFRSLKKSKPKNSIPGPRRLPVIGNLHQIASPSPHKTLRDLALKHGPLMHLQLGEISTVVVSSPEVAREVMKTHDINFSYRPALDVPKIYTYDFTNIAFAPYGPYWRHLRKVCTTELLSASRVQSFRSIREEEVLNLVKTIHEGGGKLVNISSKIFSLTYGVVARAAFGGKCKDQETYIDSITELTKLLAGFCVSDFFPSIKVLKHLNGVEKKVLKMHKENDKIIENIIREHRERRARVKNGDEQAEQEDLVDVLLRIQEENEFPLGDKNIKSVIVDVFGAGSETSSTTVEWALSEMIKHPRVMKEAQAEVRRVFGSKGNVDESGLHELKYLKAVIRETFRIRPSVPLLLPRECNQACEINGYEVPAKTRVLVNAWALGRDPNYWNDPDTFYPERFLNGSVDYMGTNYEFVPFGAGRRMCPGITFATPNLELPLAQLLFHFDWKLPNGMKGEDLDMDEVFGMTVKRKNDLVLIPTPYHASKIVH